MDVSCPSLLSFLFLLISLLPLSLSSSPLISTRHDLTFHLATRLTCFWETFSQGDKLRVSVVGGEARGQSLQLRVTSPSGSLSDWQNGHSSTTASYNLTETGVYEICVHSNMPQKVTLSIFAYDEAKIIRGVRSLSDAKKTGDNIGRSIATLQQRLYETVHSVKYTRVTMGRDEVLQKTNGDFVLRYTVAFVSLNLLVALLQVYFIRRLFRENRVGKIAVRL